MNLSSGTQSLIAGALLDFVGHLTNLPRTVKAGASELVYDLHEETLRWAAARGLPLDRVDPNLEWNKTASEVTLDMLVADGRDTPQRIAGALTSFVNFLSTSNATDYEGAFLRWATATRLEIHNPQPRWAAHWWL